MNAPVILGHVNRLGYLYCNECYPVEPRCGEIVWSDSAPYSDEECELCHRPLNAQVAK